MKSIALFLWTSLSIILILSIILGLVYFDFFSVHSSLFACGLVLLTFFIIPLVFKKSKRITLRKYINFSINVLFILLLIFLVIKSPGKPEQFKNSKNEPLENSISTWEKVEIGGIDQWLLIKGENKNNSVILYLTGGYGQSCFYYMPHYYPQLEKDFTVVYWEQRGTGKSYNKEIPESSFTFKQLTSDINEISIYLRNKFNKDKIILLGHSWGTSIGLLASKEYPENFQFFIGIGQFVNWEMNCSAKYYGLLAKSEAENNKDAIAQIKSLGEPPYEQKDKSQKDKVLNNWADYFSGSEFERNWKRIERSLYLNCPEYNLSEKIMIKSHNLLYQIYDKSTRLDFFNETNNFEIPIYFVQGENDYCTVTSVVEEYYNSITAPDKDLLILKDSGHDPNFVHPQEFHKYLLSKLKITQSSNPIFKIEL